MLRGAISGATSVAPRHRLKRPIFTRVLRVVKVFLRVSSSELVFRYAYMASFANAAALQVIIRMSWAPSARANS